MQVTQLLSPGVCKASQMGQYLILLALLLAVACMPTEIATGISDALLVDVTSGSFIGVSSIANGTDRWLGIPYALPPTGPLRFKAPVSITRPSSTIRQATTFGNACPQLPSNTLGAPMSEDCLFLNASAFKLLP